MENLEGESGTRKKKRKSGYIPEWRWSVCVLSLFHTQTHTHRHTHTCRVAARTRQRQPKHGSDVTIPAVQVFWGQKVDAERLGN